MEFKKTIIGAVAAFAITTTMVSAGGHDGNPAVKARNAAMTLYSFSLGTLGAMAKGEMEYDAAAASAAASNLAAVANLNQMAFWPEGTSNADIDGTRALPAIWENTDDVVAIAMKLAEASNALAATAGDGLEAVQAGLGPVGAECGACHKAYRAPRN